MSNYIIWLYEIVEKYLLLNMYVDKMSKLYKWCSSNLTLILAKGQYMVSWLLTAATEQRYWQNRETTNVGL